MSKKHVGTGRLRVGVLTAGGDCPGLNAVIRAVAKKLMREETAEIIGFKDGYEGLIHNDYRRLDYGDVSGILTQGGTILGTSNVANPYRYAVHMRGAAKMVDLSSRAFRTFHRLGLCCLVCIGGDGTMTIANRLHEDGMPIVGIPKTIDNDIRGTDITFGFDTAVAIATDGIDRVHTTAQSHHRVMIVEVMGRNAGWIALHAGIASGGDIILLPEIPYDVDGIAAKVQERNTRGNRFSIIVIAEGARPKGGEVIVARMVTESTIQARLGGVGFVLGEQLERLTGIETRTVVMGHLQRGGSPSAFDRVLATQLGTRAAELIRQKKYGAMVGIRGGRLLNVRLSITAGGPKTVPRDHPLIRAGRSVGTYFGD